MNNNYIAVYDLECDSVNPNIANPVEISCHIVDPRQLKIVDSFHSMIKPPDFDKEKDSKYLVEHLSTIEWHAKTLNKTVEEVLGTWSEAPPEETVWRNFTKFLNKYHKGGGNKTKWSAPIACGYNILNYDNVIMDVLKNKYNTSTLFHEVYVIDLLQTVFQWFEDNPDVEKYNFDNMRNYLGISKAGAHTAINDTECFAELLIRFMKLIRSTSKKVKFAGSFGS